MSTPSYPAPGESPGNGPAAGRTSTGTADPRAEFTAFLDDLADLAHGSPQRDVRRELEARVLAARRRLTDLYDAGVDLAVDARDRAQRGLDASRDAIADRPLASVSLAALAGLLVGLLLNRRR